MIDDLARILLQIGSKLLQKQISPGIGVILMVLGACLFGIFTFLLYRNITKKAPLIATASLCILIFFIYEMVHQNQIFYTALSILLGITVLLLAISFIRRSRKTIFEKMLIPLYYLSIFISLIYCLCGVIGLIGLFLLDISSPAGSQVLLIFIVGLLAFPAYYLTRRLNKVYPSELAGHLAFITSAVFFLLVLRSDEFNLIDYNFINGLIGIASEGLGVYLYLLTYLRENNLTFADVLTFIRRLLKISKPTDEETVSKHARKSAATIYQPNQIRVFISSTFKDMQEERDELVKQIFPQLRKLCEEQGLVWSEVDLRWGVTEEQKNAGQVLPICLAEIARSDYFIGILGERYGYSTSELPAELLKEYPWLQKDTVYSLTEIEMLYVLHHPAKLNNAFFYFRDQAYLDHLTAAEKELYSETPSPEEIKKYGEQMAAELTDNRRARLKMLKDQIRATPCTVHENYQNPKAMGELVLKNFQAVIKTYVNNRADLSLLDREREYQKNYLLHKQSMYIGDGKYFHNLDSHIDASKLPLAIIGAEGSGKSTLLATWVSHYQSLHPDRTVITHFVGASPFSSDLTRMLWRIVSEITEIFSLNLKIPDELSELKTAFTKCLNLIPASQRVIIVIDGINQLENKSGAHELLWLPQVLPENINLIASATTGPVAENMLIRDWAELELQPLTLSERLAFITVFMERYGKNLHESQITQIASAKQTKNPLFLHVLLEELRVYGDYATLDAQITRYLAAETIDQLYELILARYEKDYNHNTPDLVQNSLSLIWGARYGLAEVELLEMLGGSEPLPYAFWLPFALTIEPFTIKQSGYLNFTHESLRQAIEKRYISSENKVKEIHAKIADYFEQQPLNPRKISELPWHLFHLQSLEKVYCLLSDLAFFSASWGSYRIETLKNWNTLGKESPLFSPVSGFAAVLTQPSTYSDEVVFNIAELLMLTGFIDDAYKLFENIIKRKQRLIYTTKWNQSTIKMINILIKQGKVDWATLFTFNLKSQLQSKGSLLWLLPIKEKVYYQQLNAQYLGCESIIAFESGKLDNALSLLLEKEKLCRKLKDELELIDVLGRKALIFSRLGLFEEALRFLNEGELISKSLNQPYELISIYIIRATILGLKMNAVDEALYYLGKAEKLSSEYSLNDKYESDIEKLKADLHKKAS